MKVWLLGIIAVVIVGGLGFLYWQSQQKTATTLPSGTVIYDVRTEDEFATDHISSAKFLPLTSIQSGTLPTEPKDTPIAVYCRSGNRSKTAAELLRKAGFTNVIDMGGEKAAALQYGLSIAT